MRRAFTRRLISSWKICNEFVSTFTFPIRITELLEVLEGTSPHQLIQFPSQDTETRVSTGRWSLPHPYVRRDDIPRYQIIHVTLVRPLHVPSYREAPRGPPTREDHVVADRLNDIVQDSRHQPVWSRCSASNSTSGVAISKCFISCTFNQVRVTECGH